MSSWAKPGVKCVCIRAFNYPSNRYQLPVKGQVYTVRNVEPGEGVYAHAGPFIRLVELTNPPHHSDGVEPSFQASFFRPLITKTQEDDVAMFRHHLAGTPAGVDA